VPGGILRSAVRRITRSAPGGGADAPHDGSPQDGDPELPGTGRPNLDHSAAYRQHVRTLRETSGDEDAAMRAAIGGEFDAMGVLERELLIAQGLRPDSDVVDVGCGSGRLALPLSEYLTGSYLGTDVVPDLLDYARKIVDRPDWRFEPAVELSIPAADASADVVCFFSVFTHLLHEESYRYLEEARRVLRPGGKVVFSFLEFAMDNHWLVFESNLAAIGTDTHLNQFMSRDGIEAWARHLGLVVAAVYDGDTPHIPLPHPVTLESGQTMAEMGNLGQSVAVLCRPEATG